MKEPYLTTRSAVFSADGRCLLTGSDGFLKIWDVASGKLIYSKESPMAIMTIVGSPEGNYALTIGLDQKLRLWDIKNRTKIREFNGHADQGSIPAFSPDGRFVISASSG